MKVLLLSHIFPPAIDGGSKVIYKLGQYFESQHHQTLYLSSNCSSTDDFVKKTPLSFGHLPLKKGRNIFPSFHQGRGLRGGFCKLPVYKNLRRILKLINLFLPKKFYLHGLLKVFQKGPIFKLIPFLKATIQILKFKPDFIVAGPLPTTTILYATFLKKIINKFNFPLSSKGNAGLSGKGFCQLIINASFHPTDSDFQQIPLIKALKKADFLWTLTQSENDYFIKNFNINPHKIILAGNGIDPEFLTTPLLVKGGVRGGFNILFIGSLAAHKRIDLLIKSFSNLISSLPQGRMLRNSGEVGLIIAGQKTLFYPQIKKLINSIDPSVKSRINFKFNFPQSKLTNLIDNCDVLILPSVQESFGLVLIEAWSRQKPVICADIPALKELVNQTEGGLLFKADNQKDLTQKLKFILDNPKKAQQLGQNGYNYVRNNYTWPKVGQKIWQKISL